MWAGLGYYRRARFLHAGAQTVVREHAGMLPSTVWTISYHSEIPFYRPISYIFRFAIGLIVRFSDCVVAASHYKISSKIVLFLRVFVCGACIGPPRLLGSS
jgi:hypothetical protein